MATIEFPIGIVTDTPSFTTNAESISDIVDRVLPTLPNILGVRVAEFPSLPTLKGYFLTLDVKKLGIVVIIRSPIEDNNHFYYTNMIYKKRGGNKTSYSYQDYEVDTTTMTTSHIINKKGNTKKVTTIPCQFMLLLEVC